jgi:hypothetical protein
MGRCSCTAAPVAILSFPASSPTPAATTAGRFITTDTHWQLADNPYGASSSLLADSDAVLTIDPGVEVRFAQTTRLSRYFG